MAGVALSTPAVIKAVANCDHKRKWASIKDLGKKWFAIFKMENQDPNELISKL